MGSYSEIFYLVAGMMLFSLLSLNTARSFNTTRQTLYQTETEYRAIAVAQDEIDKVQWIYEPTDLDPTSGTYTYASYPITVNQSYGASNEYSSSFTLYGESELLEDTGTMKRYQVTVSVLNTDVEPDVFVTLDIVKSYTY